MAEVTDANHPAFYFAKVSKALAESLGAALSTIKRDMEASNAITANALHAMNIKIDDNRVAYASTSSANGLNRVTPTKKPDLSKRTSSGNGTNRDIVLIPDDKDPSDEDVMNEAHDGWTASNLLPRGRKVALIEKMESPSMSLYVRTGPHWM